MFKFVLGVKHVTSYLIEIAPEKSHNKTYKLRLHLGLLFYFFDSRSNN